ncbi:MAG: hypothetical protein EOP49_18865 [Sphingobacteriales bacterium]|nr:MAG: hypothetical protein EOP49_18865 [Sphingobacteriales bacterium]
MKILICIIVISLAVAACTTEGNRNGKKTMDFGSFQMEVPADWVQIHEHGTDSYVGSIAIGNGDTIGFDMGWYSGSITEDTVLVTMDGKWYYGTPDPISGQMQFTDTAFIDTLLKQQYAITAIDGYQARLTTPKISGRGKTGVCIDSLWKRGSGVDRFVLCGSNLHHDNEQLVLAAARTLRFSRPGER